jgi:hypothetical protein
MTDLVWYVSYGSNMSARRFYCYIHGGIPPGGSLACPGARDRSLPKSDKAVWLAGGVYFATESQVWGGGRAFYDPSMPGKAAARAYLITEQQFSDVAAQEMYKQPGQNLDLTGIATSGRVQLGMGRYETLLRVGDDKQGPMVTFTAPWGVKDVPLLSPSASYLRVIGQGLKEAYGWDSRKIAVYLASLPGAHGIWAPGDIASLLMSDSEQERDSAAEGS